MGNNKERKKGKNLFESPLLPKVKKEEKEDGNKEKKEGEFQDWGPSLTSKEE